MALSDYLLEENVGGWDLLLRALFGPAAITVLALGWLVEPWNYVAAVIAFVGLYTGITRHCLIWNFLGINTAKKQAKK